MVKPQRQELDSTSLPVEASQHPGHRGTVLQNSLDQVCSASDVC